MFPSPCGDYGSYLPKISMYPCILIDVSVPLRGLWFLSLLKLYKVSETLFRVSVPLRGLWFLSRRVYTEVGTEYYGVSVPLRGLWFLSVMHNSNDTYVDFNKFPSPCGDYGSYLKEGSFYHEKNDKVSVPLRGLWFLSTSHSFYNT